MNRKEQKERKERKPRNTIRKALTAAGGILALTGTVIPTVPANAAPVPVAPVSHETVNITTPPALRTENNVNEVWFRNFAAQPEGFLFDRVASNMPKYITDRASRNAVIFYAGRTKQASTQRVNDDV
jgi:hypothetical protein